MDQNGPEWTRMDQNGPEWTRMDQNGPEWTSIHPDRKVEIKDNHLGIKLIPMISTWDQVDPIFPVRTGQD
jgi:hypothetical protein